MSKDIGKKKIYTFFLNFEHNAIEATIDGNKSTLRKADLYIEEESDIQTMMFDGSAQHAKELLHFKIEESKAQGIWKKLKNNGWK
jgi:hypothetical protein